MKKWSINSADEKLAEEFSRQCDIGLLPLKLLTSRGCREFEQIVGFFKSDELEDPFALLDMQKAADTVLASVDAFEKICVYGDYDCDGITSTYILYTYLQSMGADVIYHINERSEGYGMNIDAVRRLHDKGVKLIITVDNGISAVEEAAEAARLGMKLVITDHHQPPEVLPQAEAIVDPHREDCPSLYKDLAGVGVALKLCAAMDDGNYDMLLEQYADIAAIGTVGDLVPLTGENRTIVRKGLLYLANTENPGLLKLMEHASVDISSLNSETLAFQICPRINAAGRFGSPSMALETLLAEDEETAENLAQTLCGLNEQRKKTEQDIYNEIREFMTREPAVLDQRVLVISGKGWHTGVIGIVAARVLEDHGKPTIIISEKEDGSATGSARSIKGFDIHDCLTYASSLLDKFGGHECAGGFSLKTEKIGAFRDMVLEFADKWDIMPSAVNECDMTVTAADLTIESVRSLSELHPFGVGNPSPLFYMPDCTVNSVIPLKGGRFTKLMISCQGGSFEAVDFTRSADKLFFRSGDKVDMAVCAGINSFGGGEMVSLRVRDIKPAGLDPDRFLAARDAYEKLARGTSLPVNYLKRMRPARKELVYVYKYLQAVKEITLDDLFMRIDHPAFNYCKLRLIADIFRETGLASFEPLNQKVKLLPVSTKADLDSAPTALRLRELIGEVSEV